MKNRVFAALSIVVLIIGVTIFALAKGNAVMAHFQHPGPDMIEHIAIELKLNDTQKVQLKSMLEAGEAAMTPLHQKMEEVQKQLDAATANGQFDEAQVRALATQKGQLTAETIVEHERMKSKIFAILTPEQRVKAEEMHKRMSKHFSGMD
jgi:Spy/CpxP family protein refolding chaperone